MSIQIADFLGIDVSQDNGTIDWKLVAQDPQKIRFAYIKATEGTTLRDASFAKNRAGATAAGIPNGAYHFFSLTSPAKTQAYNFVSLIEKLAPNDLPPMLDFEKSPTPDQINQVTDDLHTWLELIKTELGKNPVIYTSYNYWFNILKNPVSFNTYPLWVANYALNDMPRPVSDPPPLFGGWAEWALWQYTSKGTVQGIVDARNRPLFVDMDRYNSNSGILTNIVNS